MGDVVGKGLSAALLAAYLVGLYDQLMREGTGPAEVLRSMNSSILERTRIDPLFATLLALEADYSRGVWRSARAGHEQPLLVRAGGEQLELNPQPALPAGIEAGEDYQEEELAMLPGDRLFVGSDGVLEQGLGPAQVAQVLAGGAAPADALLQSLLARMSPGDARDDVTMAVISMAT